jgi:excisionase family DNA binding protein
MTMTGEGVGSKVMMGDRWLSVDEIADHLGVKRDTVYKWISERQMPGHKIGRLWKFDKTAVDEWVRSGGASDSDDARNDN